MRVAERDDPVDGAVEDPAPALWLLWFTAPLLDRGSPFATALGRRVLRRRLFGPRLTDDRALDVAQKHVTATRTSAFAAFAAGLLHHDRTPALHRLTALPVLVLTGADDATIPARHSHRLASELSVRRCELVVVPGAGDMVNVTHADVVDEALRLLRRAAAVVVRSGAPSSTPTQEGTGAP